MKHNYPKNRKPRNVEYSKSYKLFQSLGRETLTEILSRVGMFLAAREIKALLGYEVSAPVVRHCRTRYKLKQGEINETENR